MRNLIQTGAPLHLDDLFAVGRVRDAHGLKGELFVTLAASEADWLDRCDEMYLQDVPTGQIERIEIESASAHKNGLIVKPVGVADRTAAEALRGRQVLIPAEYIEADPGERLFLGQLLGLDFVASGKGVLGQVSGLSSNGLQDLLVVSNNDGEFEIPLVDELLVELRLDKNEIEMTVPEGLIEITQRQKRF